MRVPKMTKYSVAVTTGGTMVCPQMRMMRLNSRMTMVVNPTHSVRAKDSRTIRLRGADAVVDQAHEQLLEPIDLVAHAVHTHALRAELREDIVQALPSRDFYLESVVVGHLVPEARQRGRRGQGLAQIEDEHLGLELAQHIGHGVALDDAAALDDGDIAAQILGLFEMGRGQDDGGSLGVDVA